MWLIEPSVYKRCHDDAGANHPNPLTKWMQETILANKATQTAQRVKLFARLSSVCLCRKQPYSTERVSCVSIKNTSKCNFDDVWTSLDHDLRVRVAFRG